jgi:hypothetical protein
MKTFLTVICLAVRIIFFRGLRVMLARNSPAQRPARTTVAGRRMKRINLSPSRVAQIDCSGPDTCMI